MMRSLSPSRSTRRSVMRSATSMMMKVASQSAMWMPAVRRSLRVPVIRSIPVDAVSAGRIVDRCRQRLAEHAIAGIVEVVPVAWPVEHSGHGGSAQRRAHIDEASTMRECEPADLFAGALARRVDGIGRHRLNLVQWPAYIHVDRCVRVAIDRGRRRQIYDRDGG